MMRSSAFETMKRGADEIRKRRLQENFIDAAFVSNLGKVMYCVKHGVDVNVLGTSDMLWHNGTAALHLLAEKGDVTIGKYLLEIPNIQVDVRNAFGFTPLILACLANRRKFVRMLLKKGANPNYPNRCGKTPLHYCAQAPAFGIMFDLVHFKANVNVMDAFENTPFSLSVLDLTNLSMAKYLLKCGADLELENHKSLPLFIAVCLKCKVVEDIEAVIFLLTAGVNVNFKDQNGLTGLHVSALTNYLPLAMNLVKHGADISMVDSRSRTAFDVAKAHDNREVAQFLVDHQMLQDEPGKVRSLRKRSVTFNDQATADFDFKEL